MKNLIIPKGISEMLSLFETIFVYLFLILIHSKVTSTSNIKKKIKLVKVYGDILIVFFILISFLFVTTVSFITLTCLVLNLFIVIISWFFAIKKW